MSYLKHNGLEVAIGNLKIGNDTLIFNMGSATDCPSLKLGFCKLGKKCYAYKAEKMYKQCRPFRERQANYWLNSSAVQIISDFNMLATKHKKIWSRIKYLRLNESGDFYSQEGITKLSYIAKMLKENYNIITYTYTARKDLNFENADFLVKGSSNNVGNNGRTVAFYKDSRPFNECIKKGYVVCPGDCSKCNLCKEANGINIVFAIH